MSNTKKFPPVSHLADNPRYNPKRKHDDGDGGGPTMTDLTPRVENLERDMTDIKVSLARMEGRFDAIDAKFNAIDTKLDALNNRFDSVVTWKAAFVGLAVLLTGLAGIAWWLVQQILTPLLQAAGAA